MCLLPFYNCFSPRFFIIRALSFDIRAKVLMTCQLISRPVFLVLLFPFQLPMANLTSDRGKVFGCVNIVTTLDPEKLLLQLMELLKNQLREMFVLPLLNHLLTTTQVTSTKRPEQWTCIYYEQHVECFNCNGKHTSNTVQHQQIFLTQVEADLLNLLSLSLSLCLFLSPTLYKSNIDTLTDGFSSFSPSLHSNYAKNDETNFNEMPNRANLGKCDYRRQVLSTQRE